MNPSILKELQQLVAASVISEGTAERIREHYSANPAVPSNRFGIILSILGALLVGLGIVLVVAHNWDEFGRFSKTVFAFLPLVIGQALCTYTLVRKKDNFTWRESSSVILFFGVAACIALVSQVYHLGGSMRDFLLSWMLLTFPLIYLIPSRITGLLYIAGVTWYGCIVGYGYEGSDQTPYMYFPLMLLALPAYIQLMRRKNRSDLLPLYNWFAVASFSCILGAFTAGDTLAMSFLAYLFLACLYYVIGTAQHYRSERLHNNPFLYAGFIGVLIILMLWSFEWMWMGTTFRLFISGSPMLILAIVLAMSIIYLLVRRYREGEKWSNISPVEFSGFVFFLYLLVPNTANALRLLIINAWILVIALYYIRKGSLQQHLGILNLGLLIIAALAIFRFFDESIPFVWRGFFFLATGIGFFAANYIVIKRKRILASKSSI